MYRDMHIMLFKLSKILLLNSHNWCPLFSQNQPIVLNEKCIHSTGKQSSNLWMFLFPAQVRPHWHSQLVQNAHTVAWWSLSLEELGPDRLCGISKVLDLRSLELLANEQTREHVAKGARWFNVGPKIPSMQKGPTLPKNSRRMCTPLMIRNFTNLQANTRTR